MESLPSGPPHASADGGLPSRIGGYHVVRRLATGGTSDVLLARAHGPHGFERAVVLKLLLRQFQDDAAFARMFAREAAAYARLSHPAIVKLYDFFGEGGQLVMVLEYVDGLPLNALRALLRPQAGRLQDRAAMFIAFRVFSALASAHAARDPQSGRLAPVIHRDVNPSNVLIPWDGHVKIADFGIAKIAGMDGETQAGFIKGTYGYMAPEQVQAAEVTARTDVYAACLLLWELLTGRKAIVRGTLSDLQLLRLMAEPNFPSLATVRPDLPSRVLESVGRGLSPDPAQRTISADELCDVLRTAADLDQGRKALVQALVGARSQREVDAPPPADTSSGEPPAWAEDTIVDPPKWAVAEARSKTRSRPPPPVTLPSTTPAPVFAQLQVTMPAKPRPIHAVGHTSQPPTASPIPVQVASGSAQPAVLPSSTFLPSPAPPAGLLADVADLEWPPRGRRKWPIAMAALSIVGCFALIMVLRGQGRSSEGAVESVARPAAPPTATTTATATATTTATTTTTTTTTATTTASTTASEVTLPSAAPDATVGQLTISPSHAGHRVWVDNRLVGEAPASFSVRCGLHYVRVGSQGAIQQVQVPCGNEIVVR